MSEPWGRMKESGGDGGALHHRLNASGHPNRKWEA